MTFGINAGTSGSSGADLLWQLIGAAPDEIELNTTNGADGIDAELPGDTRFKLLLKRLAYKGGSAAAFRESSATENIINGIVADAGPVGLIRFVNNATGRTKTISVLPGGIVIDSYDGLDKQRSIEISDSNDEINLRAQDAVTFDETQFTVRESPVGGTTTDVLKAGATANVKNFNDTEFVLATGQNAADRYFSILVDGTIQTNQVEALTGNDATVIGRIPIADPATGAITGYVPVQTDP